MVLKFLKTVSFFITFFRRMSNSDRVAEKERRLNANMIERRRMQNINSGFTSLKRLLPPTDKKLTKAAILQQAVQHILRLQRTVVQVQENNNSLRQNLAEERKQCLALRKQCDAFVTENYARQECCRGLFCPHMQIKLPSTPPEDFSDRTMSRWPLMSCDKLDVKLGEYKNTTFDGFSCQDSRQWPRVPVIRENTWEVHESKEMYPAASAGTCKEEPSPASQESSGLSLSREFSESAVYQHRAWANNLHCIVDAINLIEKQW